jgi:hypothetical protein
MLWLRMLISGLLLKRKPGRIAPEAWNLEKGISEGKFTEVRTVDRPG